MLSAHRYSPGVCSTKGSVMRIANRLFALGFMLVVSSAAKAQPAPIPEPTANPMPSIAATINGQAIYESTVERALQSVPPEDRTKARQEVVDHLVNNTVVDQYLSSLKVTIEPAEVDKKLDVFKQEVKNQQQDFALLLKRMKMTETELKEQMSNLMRWEKFVTQQASDEKLQALFNHMPEAFDGTAIRARHILLPGGADDKSKQDAVAKLRQIKATIEKSVAADLGKIPPETDNLTREKMKQSLLEEAFGEAARGNSTCNSNVEGGKLPWFPRYGSMVESFAKPAYALQPYAISDVVATTFGYHLILVIGRKPGIPTKFTDPAVKEAVKEIYEAKLKDAILDQMKPRAKIEIVPVK